MRNKPCPRCQVNDRAEGRARCWDCLEDEIRALTRANRKIAMNNDSRLNSAKQTSRFPRPCSVPADRVLDLTPRVQRRVIPIMRGACEVAPKLKRHMYLPSAIPKPEAETDS